MFCRKKVLRLFSTDATGVLYFAEKFRMAQEFFEEYLENCGVSGVTLGESLTKGEFLFPIVHAEADFLAPIRVGDELELSLFLERIRTSSFILVCRFSSAQSSKLLGKTTIVHVTVDKKSGTPSPIPKKLREALERLEAQVREKVSI
jgi:1,4-dihydroxy-2-naphthoyl-CoA hydrolase